MAHLLFLRHEGSVDVAHITVIDLDVANAFVSLFIGLAYLNAVYKLKQCRFIQHLKLRILPDDACPDADIIRLFLALYYLILQRGQIEGFFRPFLFVLLHQRFEYRFGDCAVYLVLVQSLHKVFKFTKSSGLHL